MGNALGSVLVYLACAGLLVVNAAGVALVLLQLPGTWVMLVATALLAWWQWDGQNPMIGVWSLLIMLGLAVLGEVIETLAAARWARKAGGTKTGAIAAIVGGIAGAVLGTMLIPIPVIGTIVGACIGAGIGSIGGDLIRGRTWPEAQLAGQGAAVGRMWGTMGKVVIAVAMWFVAAVAVFWP
ncbi:MAG: DUF456 domain-containing protein [Phycisphaeraceae bacterium]